MRPRAFWFSAGTSLVAFAAVVCFVLWMCGAGHGRLETIDFSPKKAGGERRMVVYLPPDYPRDEPYPVLYLLHGAAGDETDWQEQGDAANILNQLYAEARIAPMIVVMPNEQARGPAVESDLLDGVIPYVDSHFATRTDSRGRAVAGASMGGGQALEIGLRHADRFTWIGGFSPSLSGTGEGELLSDSLVSSGKLRLLWISCGDQDRLKPLCESLHHTLEVKNVPHVWSISRGEHDWPLFKDNLRQFLPLVFR